MFCGGDELVELGVDAAGFFHDVAGQGIEVGALELGGLAVFEDLVDDRVLAGEGRQGLLVGFELAGLGLLRLVGEAELVEEDLAELLGRVEVEGAAGEDGDRLGELVDPLLELAADLDEGGGVDGDAFHFHTDEDRKERALDVLEDVLLAV